MEPHKIAVTLVVNGVQRSAHTEPRTMLAALLREDFNLTGTHIGCDTCQCGCCTVLLNGDAVKSCTVLAAQVDGNNVTTIEGLEQDGKLHRMQQAFTDNHALQCGYCTPGFIMSSVELVEKYDGLDEDRIRHLVDGNICRCTGYHNIVKAILSVAKEKQGA